VVLLMVSLAFYVRVGLGWVERPVALIGVVELT
jgi:hypothetical protein